MASKLLPPPYLLWVMPGILLGMWGCAQREVFIAPPSTPDSFSDSGTVNTPDRWWTTFEVQQLDQQIDQCLEGNLPLAAARQRILAAEAVARRESADLLFRADGSAGLRSTVNTNGRNLSQLVLGIDGSYPIDLWGEIGSRVEAQWLTASATQADYQFTALALAANVSSTWFALIEAHAQLELLENQLDTNEVGLELQEARFGLGQIRAADVLRQRQLVEATEQQVVIIQSRIEILEHVLAVLQGTPPQHASFVPGAQLPDLPPLPATGLPSDLLNRRPDIQRQYQLLLAADQQLASAISRQYPRLDLLGGFSTTTESPRDLFRDWAGSIAGQMIAPLVNGGQLRAEVERNEAVVRQRLSDFSQTVLVAYQEVEDALAREKYQIELIRHLENQAELARQSSVQLREQYLIGDVEYLDVLSSSTQEQSLRRQTLSARRDLILNRVSLYLALSGGFEWGGEALTLIETVPEAEAATGNMENIQAAESERAREPEAGEQLYLEDTLPLSDEIAKNDSERLRLPVPELLQQLPPWSKDDE